VSGRREAILAEMGLAPVWRLRESKVEKEKKPGWLELKQAVPGCTACALHKTRTRTVLGVGDESADWMLIGEAPGAEEDRLGNPEPGEVAKCSPFLQQQIALVRPKLIVAMGRFAAQTLLATDASIASLRGRVHAYAGVPLVVTYHPAYLLRNLPDKAKAWADLVFASKTMKTL
jgi:DNA polymerase